MDSEKKIKVLNAIKVSEWLHRAVAESARRDGRKIADQVRHLIERGLEAEKGTDAGGRLDAVEREIQALKAQVQESKHEESKREILARQQRGKPRQISG
jgi:hypothetical protein